MRSRLQSVQCLTTRDVFVKVPRIVGKQHVSAALGAHKAVENSGTTLFQTVRGKGVLFVRHPNSKKPATSLPPFSNTKKIAGFMLDSQVVKARAGLDASHSPIPVLRLFLALTLTQLAIVVVFWRVSRKRAQSSVPAGPASDDYSEVAMDELEEEMDRLDSGGRTDADEVSAPPSLETTTEAKSWTRRRGAVGLGLSVATITSSWIVFGVGYAWA
jgi:hypothetical protein